MPNKTTIEWTDFTSNPIRFRVRGSGERAWHCEKVSPGCAHCYAEGLELGRFGSGRPFTPAGGKDLEAYLDEGELKKILTMKPRGPGRLGAGKPRMIFIGDMTDIFGDWVPDVWLDKLFAVMALRPDLIFQVLTKRAERMAAYFENLQWGMMERASDELGYAMQAATFQKNWPMPNVWLGVSIENQPTADERIPYLLRCPAAVRWLSVEPMLGPVDVSQSLALSANNPLVAQWKTAWRGWIDWVVCGGESGRNARPLHPDWVRGIRYQCVKAGVPFFFKQWGEYQFNAVDFSTYQPHVCCIDSDGRHWALSIKDGKVSWLSPDSKVGWSLDHDPGDVSASLLEWRRVGKSAGRMLDGRTHDAYPEARA